ncbi:unnamed protein product [Rotaria magnacalcarata]|uniref:Zinc transporter 2 n=3 Tax=Rotaria magnacalcarata TaxID=392030 RepID=A0A814VXV2_9BILA|nr:unnamed protein product [Rotaria magnacalcarata]CAF4861131.1 unnamed protein product [Rotaria magnacalcarata]
MANVTEEKTPLLSIIDIHFSVDELNSRNDEIPLQSQIPVSHCHVPDKQFDYSARNRLVIVLILCLIFMIIEFVGGIFSNSTAVITDAAHMCIDAGSFLISLAALYLGRKRPTKTLSFGYIRAEVLGALASVLTIWVATGILVYMAIKRCIDQRFTVQPIEMLVVASCGVIFNIVMFLILHLEMCGSLIPHHGHSHADKHHHSHEDESSIDNHLHSHNREQPSQLVKSPNNINIRAAIIHTIGDFVQSIGVLVAAILIKIDPQYKLADPICTFVFSILVLITTFTIMRDIIFVLMEGVPSNVNYQDIIDDLHKLPGVQNVHSLHIWSLSVQKAALSVHVAINRDHDYLKVLQDAQQILRSKHSITQAAIQIEPYDEEIMTSCENCNPQVT